MTTRRSNAPLWLLAIVAVAALLYAIWRDCRIPKQPTAIERLQEIHQQERAAKRVREYLEQR
jgi:hypothetical protein